MFYEYTCCTSEGTTDGTCGDYVPTSAPTDSPLTINPSESPTVSPSAEPTENPSESPTVSPSSEPTVSTPDDLADNLSELSTGNSDEGSNAGVIMIIIFVVVVVLCLSGIAYYCGKRQKKRERIPSKAVPIMINSAQPVGITAEMHQPQASQMQYVSKASSKGVAKVFPAQMMHAEQQMMYVPQASPPMPGPMPHSQLVPQADPQDAVQMVMGQNGQWVMMQKPQSVQQMQPRQREAQQEAPQQMQFVYRMQQEKDSNLDSNDQGQSAPINSMHQFQYVQQERQRPSGDDTTKC